MISYYINSSSAFLTYSSMNVSIRNSFCIMICLRSNLNKVSCVLMIRHPE